MGRFLLKAIFFLAGMVIFLNGLGYLAERFAPVNLWRNVAQQQYANLMKRKEKIQAISIGNSHSGSIDFEALGIEGQVLTRAAADLFEVERYTADVVSELPHLKTAFIGVSYFSFSWDNAIAEDRRILRIELYAMLPGWKPIAGDIHNLLLGKLHALSRIMSVVRSDSWRNVIFGTLLPIFSDEIPAQNLLVPTPSPGECNHFSAAELETIARDIAGKHAKRSQAMKMARPNLQNLSIDALARTIEYLQEKGIRVVLFTPPYYQAYTATFAEKAPQVFAHMHQALNRLKWQYQVEYYDFSSDPQLIGQHELFLNSDHLNDCGRKVFSKRLLNTMVENAHKHRIFHQEKS